MDLDFDSSLVNFLLSTESKYSILDVASHLYHLDATLWDSMVVRHPGGLHLAPAPEPPGAAEPERDQIRSLIAFGRNIYRWIVLDLGRFNHRALSLLEDQDELMLVSSAAMPSIFLARKILTSTANAGFDKHRLKLILNRPDSSMKLSSNDLNQLFEVPVWAALPSCAGDFQDGHAVFCLPVEDSRFRREVSRLAAMLAGVTMPELPQGNSRFASLKRRFRRERVGLTSDV